MKPPPEAARRAMARTSRGHQRLPDPSAADSSPKRKKLEGDSDDSSGGSEPSLPGSPTPLYPTRGQPNRFSDVSQTGYDDCGKPMPKSRLEEDVIGGGLVEGVDKGVEFRIVDHWLFNAAVMAAICLNAIQMGLELQFESGFWPTLWDVLEHFFTAFFFIELIIKWWLMGLREYFASRANWLDCFVVFVSILDDWCLKFVLKNGSRDIGFISILRLVRLSRIGRLLRARELVNLIEGIISSIKSMFWLSILLSILIYIAAIVFVKFIGRSDAYDKEEFDVDHYFGDLVRASVTALNLALMTDWSSIVRPVLKRQPVLALCIIAYVVVSFFGVLNAIIGVIVTRTNQAAAEGAAEDEAEHRKHQMEFVESIKNIIYEIDTDGDGTVSPEEIAAAADNEALVEALYLVELPHGFSMQELHCMLDKDGDGELTKAEFHQGMKRLIFSNDFQRQCLLQLAVAQQKRRLHSLSVDVSNQLEVMSRQMKENFESLTHDIAKLLSSHNFGPMSNAQEVKIPDELAIIGSVLEDDKVGGDAEKRATQQNELNSDDIPGCIPDARVGLSTAGERARKSLSTAVASSINVQQLLAKAQQKMHTKRSTAEVSQAVLAEVSNALAQAANRWTHEEVDLQNPQGPGALRQAGIPAGFAPQGMLQDQLQADLPPHLSLEMKMRQTLQEQNHNQVQHNQMQSMQQTWPRSNQMQHQWPQAPMPSQLGNPMPNAMNPVGNQWQYDFAEAQGQSEPPIPPMPDDPSVAGRKQPSMAERRMAMEDLAAKAESMKSKVVLHDGVIIDRRSPHITV